MSMAPGNPVPPHPMDRAYKAGQRDARTCVTCERFSLTCMPGNSIMDCAKGHFERTVQNEYSLFQEIERARTCDDYKERET